MLPKLIIRGREIATSIVQGGMGIEVSGLDLVVGVILEGGLGTLSSAGMRECVFQETGKIMTTRESVCWMVKEVKRRTSGGYVGINIMEVLARDYVDSVLGAIDGGVDFIMAVAGLHLKLPAIVGRENVALIPIISSLRALEGICGRWSRHNRLPDAVIIEGPLAGGHLGFKFDELSLAGNRLENLFPSIKQYANQVGIPVVIVAGGVYSYEDIVRWHNLGADGVQLGTRLAATEESKASQQFKCAIVECTDDDIIIVHSKYNYPGSPCGLSFRAIKSSPGLINNKLRKAVCDKGYAKPKDRDCPAKSDPEHNFCVCNSLFAAIGYGNGLPIFTIGANGALVKEISTVAKVMQELRGDI